MLPRTNLIIVGRILAAAAAAAAASRPMGRLVGVNAKLPLREALFRAAVSRIMQISLRSYDAILPTTLAVQIE